MLGTRKNPLVYIMSEQKESGMGTNFSSMSSLTYMQGEQLADEQIQQNRELQLWALMNLYLQVSRKVFFRMDLESVGSHLAAQFCCVNFHLVLSNGIPLSLLSFLNELQEAILWSLFYAGDYDDDGDESDAHLVAMSCC